jgi:hypothetical protein
MAKRTKIGDVFEIPVSENKKCFGQVIAKRDPAFYMAGFDFISDIRCEIKVADIVEQPILFLGNFGDILIRMGNWKVIGNVSPDLSRIPFPCYLVFESFQHFAENWGATNRRLATSDEVRRLDGRDFNGAAFLEECLKCRFGIIPSDPKYDRFTIEIVKSRTCTV